MLNVLVGACVRRIYEYVLMLNIVELKMAFVLLALSLLLHKNVISNKKYFAVSYEKKADTHTNTRSNVKNLCRKANIQLENCTLFFFIFEFSFYLYFLDWAKVAHL